LGKRQPNTHNSVKERDRCKKKEIPLKGGVPLHKNDHLGSALKKRIREQKKNLYSARSVRTENHHYQGGYYETTDSFKKADFTLRGNGGKEFWGQTLCIC